MAISQDPTPTKTIPPAGGRKKKDKKEKTESEKTGSALWN